MIKTIIFDLGRVLIPFDFHRAYELMEQRSGIPAADIPALIFPSGIVRRFESGDLEAVDFVDQLSAVLGLDLNYKEFAEIWSSIFHKETLVSEDFIQRLAKNYRVILLSNTNSIHFDMVVENYPLLRHFHAYVLSYKVRSMKPAPAIYQIAIEEAQCLPNECFFTDDIRENIDGALAMGIDAVLFESGTQIEAELRKRGLNW